MLESNSGCYKIQFKFRFIAIIFCTLSILFVQKPETIRAEDTCTGPISVMVSTDGKTPAFSVTLPAGPSKRYYIHVNSGGAGCSTAFEAYYCSEPADNNICIDSANWHTAKPWSTFRSNSAGIARIDWDNWNSSHDNKIYHARLRRLNSNDSWSNEIIQRVTDPATQPVLDLSDYWISKPGYVWEYINKNYYTGTTTRSRIQIEKETLVCSNPSTGVNLISTPWRITKNHPDAYWDPAPVRNGLVNERWMMVSPGFSIPSLSNFNNYYYMIGDKRYGFSPDNPENAYRNININDPKGGYFFRTAGLHSPPVPGYNYLPKKIARDYIYLDTFENDQTNLKVFDTHFDYSQTGCEMIAPTVTNPSSWKTRVEKVQISINNPGFQYSGDAIRMDNFEGYYPLGTHKDLLRESWYFVKNIGLVRIVGKHLNDYNSKGAPYCINESDCWADEMETPFLDMTLDRYYQNPTLSVLLSPDRQSWNTSIFTTLTQGFYLKTDPPYTGYLEAKDWQGQIHKWLWVENGLSERADISGFPLSTPFPAQFRVWVPDDQIPYETLIIPTQSPIPWSNEVVFTLQQPVSPNPTPVFIPGDANGDGLVNKADLIIWAGNYAKLLTGANSGDFDNNSKVNILDYGIWFGNFGK